MNKLYTFIPKRTFILMLFLLGAILILGSILFINQPKNETPSIQNPVISQSPSKLSPLQKSVIGKTTMDEINQSYPDKQVQNLSNGDPGYLFVSALDARPNQVVFHNKIAVFERVVLLGSPANSLKISDMVLKYGRAETTKEGSSYYGARMFTYIYPGKGLAFIANPNTDEIFELQTFTPMPLEDYLSNYGEDIHEYPEIRE